MALSAAERKRNQRAREKEERAKLAALQPAKPTEDQIQNRLSQHVRDLEWAQEQDALGHFYKSECRSLVHLLAIYEGIDISAKETEEEDDEVEKKPKRESKKGKRRPNPSLDKVTIRAIELVDSGITVSIDPFWVEYETLAGHKIDPRALYEVNEVVSFRRWLDLRDKARKDLFWLCNVVGMPMSRNAHQMICDMFVQKNFDGLFFKGMRRGDIPLLLNKQKRVAQDGVTPTKTMMLFAPRGGRKSTIDGIDAVQWLLNCPDLNIMVATAYKDLATTLFLEIKGYFHLPEDSDPTPLQILFPEYVLCGKAGEVEKNMKCPAALFKSKDPNLWKTSMESSSTGKRCHIRKLDDVVDDKNSNTDELRDKIVKKINSTNNLLAGGAFTDIVGTRYFTTDWYGTRMKKDPRGGEPAPYSHLCISAWSPKPQYRALYNQLLNEDGGMYRVTEDMVDVWWPQSDAHNFAALKRLLSDSKELLFRNQQLNVATDPEKVDDYINQFNEDVLRSHTYDRSKAPDDMEIIQSWDLAYTENDRKSDWCVGTTLGFYRNKKSEWCCVILDVFAEKLRSSQLPFQMVAYYERHKPRVVYLENANGVNFLLPNLAIASKKKGSEFFQKLVPRPVSNKPNAKRERIKDLEFLLGHDRLWIVSGGWIDLLYKQFTEYKGGKSTATRKDDIPDAVSLGVISHLPPTALQHNPDPKDVEKDEEARLAKAAKDAHYARTFGSPGTRLHPAASQTPLTRSQWERLRKGESLEPPPPQVDLKPPQNPRAEQLKKLIGKILPPGMRY